MQCEPNFWVIAGQLATPIVVAGVGAFFAWQQISTAKKKLRLDHFDKRFTVFNAARNFLGRALALGEVSIADQNEFLSGTLGATFLFRDATVSRYLDELLKRIVDLPYKLRESQSAEDDVERELARKKYMDERNWLREQYDVLEETFRSHLQLND